MWSLCCWYMVGKGSRYVVAMLLVLYMVGKGSRYVVAMLLVYGW